VKRSIYEALEFPPHIAIVSQGPSIDQRTAAEGVSLTAASLAELPAALSSTTQSGSQKELLEGERKAEGASEKRRERDPCTTT
jgi:hypothetical protein